MCCGIFSGYRTAPGGRWNGEYLVADLNEFVGKPLRWDEPAAMFSRVAIHVTKKVKLGASMIRYPLRERCNWYNYTVEGREHSLDFRPDSITGERSDRPDPVVMPDGDAPDLKFDTSPYKVAVDDHHEDDEAIAEVIHDVEPKKETTPLEPGYHGIYIDTLGRKYMLDVWGNRI